MCAVSGGRVGPRVIIVVMVAAGCGHRADAPSDAAGNGSAASDATEAGDGSMGLDGASAIDGPSVDSPGAPPACTVTPIDPPNHKSSRANAIDSAGNVAGTYVVDLGDTHAFRWHASTGFVDLGTLGGGSATALGISGALTVGTSTVAPGDRRPFLSDATGMHELPVPPGAHDGRALGVNASGIAVGDATLPDGAVHALKYQGGVAIDLGALTGRRNSTAFAISDSGVIVGSADDSGPSDRTAVMWVNGGVITLGPGTATAVNAAGDIAVGELTAYHGGTVTPLEIPGGPKPFTSGVVLGVNNAGWIVGSVRTLDLEGSGSESPTLYVDGVVWDMNQLVVVSRHLWWAGAINDAGQIAGNDGFRSAQTGAALLITCTRP